MTSLEPVEAPTESAWELVEAAIPSAEVSVSSQTNVDARMPRVVLLSSTAKQLQLHPSSTPPQPLIPSRQCPGFPNTARASSDR